MMQPKSNPLRRVFTSVVVALVLASTQAKNDACKAESYLEALERVTTVEPDPTAFSDGDLQLVFNRPSGNDFILEPDSSRRVQVRQGGAYPMDIIAPDGTQEFRAALLQVQGEGTLEAGPNAQVVDCAKKNTHGVISTDEDEKSEFGGIFYVASDASKEIKIDVSVVFWSVEEGSRVAQQSYVLGVVEARVDVSSPTTLEPTTAPTMMPVVVTAAPVTGAPTSSPTTAPVTSTPTAGPTDTTDLASDTTSAPTNQNAATVGAPTTTTLEPADTAETTTTSAPVTSKMGSTTPTPIAAPTTTMPVGAPVGPILLDPPVAPTLAPTVTDREIQTTPVESPNSTSSSTDALPGTPDTTDEDPSTGMSNSTGTDPSSGTTNATTTDPAPGAPNSTATDPAPGTPNSTATDPAPGTPNAPTSENTTTTDERNATAATYAPSTVPTMAPTAIGDRFFSDSGLPACTLCDDGLILEPPEGALVVIERLPFFCRDLWNRPELFPQSFCSTHGPMIVQTCGGCIANTTSLSPGTGNGDMEEDGVSSPRDTDQVPSMSPNEFLIPLDSSSTVIASASLDTVPPTAEAVAEPTVAPTTAPTTETIIIGSASLTTPPPSSDPATATAPNDNPSGTTYLFSGTITLYYADPGVPACNICGRSEYVLADKEPTVKVNKLPFNCRDLIETPEMFYPEFCDENAQLIARVCGGCVLTRLEDGDIGSDRDVDTDPSSSSYGRSSQLAVTVLLATWAIAFRY